MPIIPNPIPAMTIRSLGARRPSSPRAEARTIVGKAAIPAAAAVAFFMNSRRRIERSLGMAFVLLEGLEISSLVSGLN
jgi:hypothetical protein